MQKNKAAQALGKMTSPKKKISSKLNGLKGGYPKGRPNKKKENNATN